MEKNLVAKKAFKVMSRPQSLETPHEGYIMPKPGIWTEYEPVELCTRGWHGHKTIQNVLSYWDIASFFKTTKIVEKKKMTLPGGRYLEDIIANYMDECYYTDGDYKIVGKLKPYNFEVNVTAECENGDKVVWEVKVKGNTRTDGEKNCWNYQMLVKPYTGKVQWNKQTFTFKDGLLIPTAKQIFDYD